MIVKTDMLLQTLMVLAWLLLAVAEGLGGKALLAGMILLNWQVLSSLIMVVFRSRFRTECIVFLIVAMTFQVLINVAFVVAPDHIGALAMIFVKTIPPLLSGFYYILTILSLVRRGSHKGKFLPHTSF
jgi:hypothetical protein